MSGIQQMIMNSGGVAPLAPIVYLVTLAGSGSYTTPTGYSKVTVEAIGGGGQGFGNNTAGDRAGGGGGPYAKSNTNISVTGDTTVVYYTVGAPNGGATTSRSWVNVGTNAAPASATLGCLAPGGTNAASATAGTGSTTGGVGATLYAGGTGTTGTNGIGGGGAGSNGPASGQTAGTSSYSMGGGTGGAKAGGTGTAPGGAGGGATSTGSNPTGAAGRIRIVFTP